MLYKKIFFFITFLFFISSLYAETNIVVTIPPVYNITKAVTGDTAEIILLIPPGISPHTFSPKPSQLKVLAGADVFIQIGASLEFWSSKMIKASGNKNIKIITLSQGMDLIAEEDHGDHEKEESHSTGNPHIWLDPVLVKDMAEKIHDELVKIDSGFNKKTLTINYNKFIMELDVLDKYLMKEIKGFRIKEIVSFHPAWAYFERRYGLREVGVVQASPGREPSMKEIQEIVKQIKRYNITTIFAEPQLPRKAADAIASESGVKVLILDPLGFTDENGIRGYVNHIKSNFEIMKKAMK